MESKLFFKPGIRLYDKRLNTLFVFPGNIRFKILFEMLKP
jgi:hypothetical protein